VKIKSLKLTGPQVWLRYGDSIVAGESCSIEALPTGGYQVTYADGRAYAVHAIVAYAELDPTGQTQTTSTKGKSAK
jgi:hypothetical protein